ncbi:uncharacterized protein SCHCODRAFT_02701501 [Schizophyllum commune H4-8]|nr:uncharacterized protein SCHCODRAFT_02701501 [Schizophyllum commune H4-8]KAI5892592.1 hypothetical protein SCHCODRAFT_02701501 [Schizophyllum commune H4-8]
MAQTDPVFPPGPMVMEHLEFTDSERSSVRVVNGFAVISTLALVSVAVRIAWLATRRFLRKDPTLPKEYAFFRTQLGNYAVCLLVANMCNCVSGLMGIKYTVDSGIDDNSYCQAQAVMMQLGNCATAYFTVAIAFHSFASLGLRVRHSAVIGTVTITAGWVGSVLLVTLPTLAPRDAGPLYGISGLSCAVRNVYPTQQFEFHILPIFIASVLSAILYSLIFLVLRGTLKIRDGISLNFNPAARYDMTEGQGYHQFVVSIAHSLVWYPIVYIILMLPYSITLLLAIAGFAIPFPVIMVAFVLYFMISVANVLLLYNTFRVLGPAFDSPSFTTPSKTNVIGTLASAFSSKKDLEKDGNTMSWYSQSSQPRPSLQSQTSVPTLAYNQAPSQHSRAGNTSYAAGVRQPSAASMHPRQLSVASSLSSTSEKQPESPEIGSWRVPQPAPVARKMWERKPSYDASGAPSYNANATPRVRYNADGSVAHGSVDSNMSANHNTGVTSNRISVASSESSLRVLVLPSQQRPTGTSRAQTPPGPVGRAQSPPGQQRLVPPPNRAQTPSVASQDIRGWLARQPENGGMPRQPAAAAANPHPTGRLPRELMMGRPSSPTGSLSSTSSAGSRRLVKPYRGQL